MFSAVSIRVDGSLIEGILEFVNQLFDSFSKQITIESTRKKVAKSLEEEEENKGVRF